MSNFLFQTKHSEELLREAEDPQHRLKRTLTVVDLTALGIGAIIGAGIFATTGAAVAGTLDRPGAGPALMLSYLLTAAACGFCALCYAEFASMIPVSGSAYTYAYATLGELIAWIIGWDLIIEYAIGNVAVAVSWAGYFKELMRGFGIDLPGWLTTDYRTAQKSAELLANAPHLGFHSNHRKPSGNTHRGFHHCGVGHWHQRKCSMFGWLNRAKARASRLNRSVKFAAAAPPAGRIFSATMRSSAGCRAL